MKTTWLQDVHLPGHHPLPSDVSTDVVVIGAGLAGTMAAYAIAQTGKRVIVIDKDSAREGMTTSYTTAFLATDIDTDLSDLITMFGARKGGDVWRSASDSIDMIESIAKQEKIDCEFMRVPEYWISTSEHGLKGLKEEASRGKDIGFDIEKVKDGTLAIRNSGAYAFKGQAKFHPLKFLVGLEKAAEKLGVVFYGTTEASEVKEEKGVVSVSTNRGTISAGCAIIATYLPFQNPPAVFARKGMYISYVYELAVPKGYLPEGIYLDDENPYHYFRIDKGQGMGGKDRMIFGGEDHRKELPVDEAKQFQALKDYLAERMPGMEYSITTSWTGYVLETLDGLPYIGVGDNAAQHILYVTGFSGNGMTYAATAARIVTAIVSGRKDKYAAVYDPHRTVSASGVWYKSRDYVGEFFGGYFKNLFRKKDGRKK